METAAWIHFVWLLEMWKSLICVSILNLWLFWSWHHRWCIAPVLQLCDLNRRSIILHFNQMDYVGQFNLLMEGWYYYIGTVKRKATWTGEEPGGAAAGHKTLMYLSMQVVSQRRFEISAAETLEIKRYFRNKDSLFPYSVPVEDNPQNCQYFHWTHFFCRKI